MIALGLSLAKTHTAEGRSLLQDGATTLAATAGEDDATVKQARAALADFVRPRG
jgi:hypothetical protein